MKVILNFLATSALLLTSTLAMPVDTDVATQSQSVDPNASLARGMPVCNSRYLEELCIIAKDSGAYCDEDARFRCNASKEGQCKSNCWCE